MSNGYDFGFLENAETGTREDEYHEELYGWVRGRIEKYRVMSDGSVAKARYYFPSVEDGGLFPDNPADIADEVVKFLTDHPALGEVAALLVKIDRLDGRW